MTRQLSGKAWWSVQSCCSSEESPKQHKVPSLPPKDQKRRSQLGLPTEPHSLAMTMPAPICRFHLNGVRARELEIPEKTGLSKNPLALKLRCTECLIIRVAKRPVIHTRRVELVKRRITVVTRISSTVASSAISSLWIGMLLPRSYAPTYEGLAEGRIHNSSIPKTVRRDRTAHVRKQRFSKTASFGPFGSFFPVSGIA